MRWLLIAFALLLSPVTPARAQVSVGIDIGINVPVYPDLVLVPGYPVYYAPNAGVNYFFYDGLYWVYVGDSWYASSWYDGPWRPVRPAYVPVYLLRVPVRYYRYPPPYFRGWREDAPPRWGQRWGRDWEHRRAGWDRWDRRAAPRPAPLPAYQRQYSGDRYPRSYEAQRALRSENYRYRPREPVTRQQYAPPGDRGPSRGEPSRQAPGRQRGPEQPMRGPPARQEPLRGPEQPQRAPPQRQESFRQQPGPRAPPPERQAPAAGPQDRRGGRPVPAPQGGGREERGDRGEGRR